MEDLESEGWLKMAIDSILLVVLPGTVGEVPTKITGEVPTKDYPSFCAHFPPFTTMDLVNSRCSVIFVQKSETQKMRDCKYPELVNNSLLMRTWES